MALVQPPAQTTGWSTFWNQVAPAGQGGSYQQRFFRSAETADAARALGARGFRKWRVAMRALNGAAAGGTTVDTYKRVTAVQAFNDAQSNGGRRAIQTVDNGIVTTTAMRDLINARVYDWPANTQAYPTDRGGNGGGGKLGR